MGLQKGQTNNTSGRPKGSTNKVTKDLREWITAFINRNTQQIEQDWQALEPKERILMFEKLLKYTLPHLQAVSNKIDFENLTDEQLDTIIEELKKSQYEQAR